MTLKCPKCGKELFVEDSGYLSECPFCHHPVQYGTAPKEEPPTDDSSQHPQEEVKDVRSVDTWKLLSPFEKKLVYVAFGSAVLIPILGIVYALTKNALLWVLLVPTALIVIYVIWLSNSRASSCSKIKAKDTNEQSDDPFERWVKDFYYFKVFITQHLVAYVWSFIIALSVLGVFIFKWPEVQVRIFIALLVILVSRVLLEFVVVLFGIAGLLRDIKEELCQKKVEA